MTEHYPYSVCTFEVEDDDKFDKSVQCNLCDRWIHLNYAQINNQKFEKLKIHSLAWYCGDCAAEIPFSDLSNKDFNDFLYSTTIPKPSQILQKLSKEIKRKMSHFKHVNQLFNQSENPISLTTMMLMTLTKS